MAVVIALLRYESKFAAVAPASGAHGFSSVTMLTSRANGERGRLLDARPRARFRTKPSPVAVVPD